MPQRQRQFLKPDLPAAVSEHKTLHAALTNSTCRPDQSLFLACSVDGSWLAAQRVVSGGGESPNDYDTCREIGSRALTSEMLLRAVSDALIMLYLRHFPCSGLDVPPSSWTDRHTVPLADIVAAVRDAGWPSSKSFIYRKLDVLCRSDPPSALHIGRRRGYVPLTDAVRAERTVKEITARHVASQPLAQLSAATNRTMRRRTMEQMIVATVNAAPRDEGMTPAEIARNLAHVYPSAGSVRNCVSRIRSRGVLTPVVTVYMHAGRDSRACPLIVDYGNPETHAILGESDAIADLLA